MPSDKSKAKDRLYLFIFFLFSVAMGLLFWNQYRPRVILARCSEVALQSSQSFRRTHLETESNQGYSYEELLNQCLQDFGV